MKHVVLLGWFFLAFWDGRITRLDFQTKETCEVARADVVQALGGWTNRVSKGCIFDQAPPK